MNSEPRTAELTVPYKVGPRALHYPTLLWTLILVVLFGTEYVLMLVMPLLLASEPSPLTSAVVDALAVTAVLAPVIWWTLVRPLREAIRLRTRFLGDLFTAMEAERRQTAHELHDEPVAQHENRWHGDRRHVKAENDEHVHVHARVEQHVRAHDAADRARRADHRYDRGRIGDHLHCGRRESA